MSNTNTPGQPNIKPGEMINRDKMTTSYVLDELIKRVDWLLHNHLNVDNILPVIDEATGIKEALAMAAAVVADVETGNTDDGNGEPVEPTFGLDTGHITFKELLEGDPGNDELEKMAHNDTKPDPVPSAPVVIQPSGLLTEMKQKEDRAQAAEDAKVQVAEDANEAPF